MDTTDRKIIRALLEDGRQTNACLAETVGLSPSATLERVRRLERDGSIQGYRAVVEPKTLGYGVQAIVGLRLRVHTATKIEPFEQAIKECDGIVRCYHVTGQFDYVAHVVARDLAHLRELNNRQIAAIPGLAKLETMVVLTQVKDASLQLAEE